jgi:flavin reductase (DIM6/NTAB) family NADH-FMN oxidoreductase RutF
MEPMLNHQFACVKGKDGQDMEKFRDLRMVDNFYQTSSFFPMPTVVIGTLCEDGRTTFGPYSLVFPYYVAGKDYYAMLLCSRNSSNTSQNLLVNPRCSLSFIPDNHKFFKECVRLGFPGDTPEEKMKDCLFTQTDGLMAFEHPGETFPKVVEEAFQVFECTWMNELDNAKDDKPGRLDGYEPPYHDFNGITSKFGAHFILRVDKILMKERQYDAIINGVKPGAFPRVPVDYGFRDNTTFWLNRFRRPMAFPLPKRTMEMNAVRYAADRADDTVKFTDDACAMLMKVPRIFLSTALKGCVDWAKANGVILVTEEHMKVINDKRSREKR